MAKERSHVSPVGHADRIFDEFRHGYSSEATCNTDTRSYSSPSLCLVPCALCMEGRRRGKRGCKSIHFLNSGSRKSKTGQPMTVTGRPMFTLRWIKKERGFELDFLPSHPVAVCH